MIQQEYIEKFEKIISYYNIDKFDVYDVAKAISFAESFGTHPISINDLAECGVDYFKDITNAPKAKELPDTRIMRMLCDTLTIILFTTNNTLFSSVNFSNILRLLSDNVSNVLIETDKYVRPNSDTHLGKNNNHYKSVEECKQVLDTFESSCQDITEWDNLKEFESTINNIISQFSNSSELKDIISDFTKDVYTPISFEYLGRYKKNIVCEAKETINKIKLKTTIAFLYLDILTLSRAISSNKVKANLRLAKLVESTNKKVGVYSMVNDVPSFDYMHFNGSTVYFTDKLGKIFDKSRPLDYDNIPFLAAFYYYFKSDDLKLNFNSCISKFEEVE